MEKKAFKDTSVGRFLGKAASVLPGVAGLALGAVADPKGALAEVAGLLRGSTSPEAQQLLHELEVHRMDFEKELQQIAAQDRHSARQREIVLKNSVGVWVQNMAAAAVVAVFCVLLFIVIFFNREITNKELAYTLLGQLTGVVLMIYNYWFGSSEGSKQKDELNAWKNTEK